MFELLARFAARRCLTRLRITRTHALSNASSHGTGVAETFRTAELPHPMIPFLRLFKPALVLFSLAFIVNAGAATKPMHKLLLVTGQSNKYHDWSKSSPLVKKHLEDSGLFTVDVATTPSQGSDMSSFKPDFKSYAAVVVVYEGDEWPAENAVVRFAD